MTPTTKDRVYEIRENEITLYEKGEKPKNVLYYFEIDNGTRDETFEKCINIEIESAIIEKALRNKVDGFVYEKIKDMITLEEKVKLYYQILEDEVKGIIEVLSGYKNIRPIFEIDITKPIPFKKYKETLTRYLEFSLKDTLKEIILKLVRIRVRNPEDLYKENEMDYVRMMLDLYTQKINIMMDLVSYLLLT